MNKDFWKCIDRLEELAGKATQGEWCCDDSGYVFRNPQASSEEGQMPIVLLNRTFNQAKQGKFDGAFIAAANPAMILEMIAEMRRLEKEADWLSMSLAKRGNTEIFCCPEGEPYKPIMECVAEHGSCANCWREAARKYIEG